jgi:hypothetical protein
MEVGGWSWATLRPMRSLQKRSRTILGALVAAAVLVIPATVSADCMNTIVKAAFKGSVAEWYPQQCYTAALAKLGPNANTYSPNVARNIRSARNRDRTHKLKFTIKWQPTNKVRVTSNNKLKSSIQLRKGTRILTKGSISSKTTLLKLKKTKGTLRVAVIWTLGKKKVTVTAPAPLAKVVKKK